MGVQGKKKGKTKKKEVLFLKQKIDNQMSVFI
jgi:hypothetical protein